MQKNTIIGCTYTEFVNAIDFSKIEEAAFLDNMFVRISIVSSKSHSVVQGISIFWWQNWFHISVIQDLSMTRSFFSNCSFFPARQRVIGQSDDKKAYYCNILVEVWFYMIGPSKVDA